jgi:hypothetical protein
LLGLTPLVSEPSWPPVPGQAWLRIALLKIPAKPVWSSTGVIPAGQTDEPRISSV